MNTGAWPFRCARVVLYGVLLSSLPLLPVAASTPAEQQPFAAAAAYLFARGGTAMLVLEEDGLVFQHYGVAGASTREHRLFSGSKSFACVIAAAAVGDGKLEWDAPASTWLREWQDAAGRSRISIRHLLSLESGLDPRQGQAEDSDLIETQAVGSALQAHVLAPPGRRFAYGPYPFLAFAKVVQSATGERADVYLRRRVLDPLGIRVAWIGTTDGYPHLADGALMSALDWLRFGQFIRDGGRSGGRQLVQRDALSQCFRSSSVNRSYGMGWWLGGWGRDRFVAARGQFNQGLYIFPERGRVVVVLSEPAARRPADFDEAAFLRKLARIRR